MIFLSLQAKRETPALFDPVDQAVPIYQIPSDPDQATGISRASIIMESIISLLFFFTSSRKVKCTTSTQSDYKSVFIKWLYAFNSTKNPYYPAKPNVAVLLSYEK
jgi:hypothetical protein